MKKLYYLIVTVLISSLVLTGCSLLSNVGQVPTSEQSGITYLTKGTPFTVGNDATERPIADTYHNFTIIDTNNPSSEFGALNTFSYYAANTNPFRFVLVDEFSVVQWVSEEITPPGIGTQSWPSLTPVPVEPDWNLGLYFALTGTVPFEYDIASAPACYEPNNAGKPEVGDTLSYAGSSNRVYSFVATGTVRYDWTGFFRPVDNPPTLNAAKAGRAIPVKFSLNGYQGLEEIFATGYPNSYKINCDTIDSLNELENTVTAGDSSLSYDAGDDQYTYVWKTDEGWAGTCRKLVILLNDGTSHEAYFTFK